jgi:Ser/Thr protein kinase RdoA (MazF antagonist)
MSSLVGRSNLRSRRGKGVGMAQNARSPPSSLHYPAQRTLRLPKVSPAEHVASVEKYLQIAPHLVPSSEDYLLRPTLRHPDFQPRNIFVTDDFTITGVID